MTHPVMTFDPKSHVLIVGGIKVDGWKSCAIKITNKRAIEGNADGSATVVETTVRFQFEGTITVASQHSGNNILNTAWQTGSFVPILFKNAKGLTTFFCKKAVVDLSSFGADDGGSDTPVEYSVQGVANVIIPGGSLTFDVDLSDIMPPALPV